MGTPNFIAQLRLCTVGLNKHKINNFGALIIAPSGVAMAVLGLLLISATVQDHTCGMLDRACTMNPILDGTDTIEMEQQKTQ